MHKFVAAHNSVNRAGFDAQGAADAPVLVYKCHSALLFAAKLGVKWYHRVPSDAGQPFNTLCAARWALVDGGAVNGYGMRIAGAVWVAAALALCLGQGV